MRRVSADKKLWLEEMIAKELKIGGMDLEEPNKSAVVMFVSYIAGGILPVLPFVFLPVPMAMAVASAVTILALFAVGFVKGRALSNDGLKSGMEMLLISSSAAVIGYLVGKAAGSLFGLDIR